VAANCALEKDVLHLLQPSSARPPIAGIVHAAAVFDDKLAVNLDHTSLKRVWEPKVTGAVLLDQHTRHLQLDWMVLYSSATTFIGNPGQANYVAANTVLEALACKRSAEGFPTLAVSWGAIDDAGHLTRHQEVKEILATRLGKEILPAAKALDAMGQLLARGIVGTRAVLPIEWGVLRRSLPLARSRNFAWMEAENLAEHEDGSEPTDFQAMARELLPDELRKIVVENLMAQLSHILRLSVEKIDPARPVAELGMDSLMTLEMGMAIESQFGIAPPALHLSATLTINGLADIVLQELSNATESSPGDELSTLKAQAASLISTHGENLDATLVEEAVAEILETSADGKKLPSFSS